MARHRAASSRWSPSPARTPSTALWVPMQDPDLGTRPASSSTSTATFRPIRRHLSKPHYDLAAEFGGYIPGLRTRSSSSAPSILPLIRTFGHREPIFLIPAEGSSTARVFTAQTTLSWAGKLTYNPFSKLQVELASFGDPSGHNVAPFTLSTANILPRRAAISGARAIRWGASTTPSRRLGSPMRRTPTIMIISLRVRRKMCTRFRISRRSYCRIPAPR